MMPNSKFRSATKLNYHRGIRNKSQVNVNFYVNLFSNSQLLNRTNEFKYVRPIQPEPPIIKTPVIVFTDANNFDDFISIILLSKDPTIEIKLIVIEYGFNDIEPASDILCNLLDWLHNKNVKVIRGYYLSEKEVEVGFNPTFETNNNERINTIGLPFCKQFVGGPWRANGSLIYGNQKRIPVSTKKNYYYYPVGGNDYIVAEDEVKNVLDQIMNTNKATLFLTGPLTTFSKFIKKYIYNPSQNIDNTQYMIDRVTSIRIMNGCFNNASATDKYLGIPPVGTKLPNGSIENGLNGNVFSLPSFNFENNFKTKTELNTLLDPEGAKIVYEYLALPPENVPPSYILTTNASDNMHIPYSIIEELLIDKTYESELVAYIFNSIKTFEGSIENFNAIIKLWDIASILVFFNPSFIENVTDPYSGSSDKLSAIKGKVEVHLPTTYDPFFLIQPLKEAIDGPYYYSELTFEETNNTNLHILYDKYVRNDGPGTGENPVIPKIFQNFVDRLKSKVGTATTPLIVLDI